MKKLYKFLTEHLNIFEAGGYNVTFNNAEDTINFINKQRKDPLDQTAIDFINYLYSVWNKEPLTTPFRLAEGNKKVKVSRANYRTNDSVQNYLSNIGIDGYQESFKVGNLNIIWGEGSATRSKNSTKIATDIQETISAMVFNKFSSKSNITKDMLLSEDFGDFNEYMKYDDWVTSWVNQFNTIQTQLSSWSNLVAVRYGDDDEVSNTIIKIHNKIVKELKSPQKDTFDPSDIIIYDKTAQKDIIERFSNIPEENVFTAAKALITDLFDEKKYVGVSLKKGVNFLPLKLNFLPIEGFEGACIKSINYDPCEMFFKDEKPFNMSHTEYNTRRKNKKTSPTKSLTIVIDTDEDENIKLYFRTNHDGYRESLILEPQLNNAKAFIGKCPATKYPKYLDQFNKGFLQLKNTQAKNVKYDIDDLCKKWDYVRKYIDAQSTSKDIRDLFEYIMPIEKYINSELYSYYMQINFLYALFKSDIETSLRNILLWAEKIDEDCLPYLLIKPN